MARQSTIPGTERKVDAEVAAAGVAYVQQRDKRMGLTKKEKAAKDALIALMRKKKVDVYRDDDANPPVILTLTEKYDVKATKVQEEDEDEDDGGEDQAA